MVSSVVLPVANPIDPAATESSANNEKHLLLIAHLLNQVRIKKSEIGAARDKMGQLGRESAQLQTEMHHIEQDVRRVEGELYQVKLDANKQESTSKGEQVGMNDKDTELKRRSDGIARLERDIDKLKQAIAEREQRIAEIKTENSSLAKSKEDLRRKIELELAGIRVKAEKAREKETAIRRIKQDHERKKMEIFHKKSAPVDRLHSALDNQREVSRLESDLRHIEQELSRTEGELRLIETSEHQEENTSRVDQGEMRNRDMVIYKTGDEVVKLGREIGRLNVEIAEKESEIAKLGGEGQELRKGREELRRRYELEHFSANSGFTLAHEKELQLSRFKQGFLLKEDKIKKNEHAQIQLRHDLISLEQDLATVEAELRHANSA
ncbi:MAG: hypothetical protein A2845_00600 [Candidatus Lloydbacteria bacterium RIFCSPHIGHO2_01_FULL_49_22]|uniref:Uncharacterized protein n=1 Tax=Candidatus Lloydbacteria bacterium RIFCSPHIGHO2_01_FULL_49_22 TaxID=1798658 RepID=A0A1G2D067_9BACT|nr:MAG: hypothetical protein A2845_00600 [Candidatus Lloydbacteria bacterium RIFCSPHIGHO2_01_FULL_49_22]OGZ09362.1 MAG: hypothetical protein A3C14_05505 [Candidatus Lloydbacteria bacterium RIFCSPHIGHO2_02_FULL_50_18]